MVATGKVDSLAELYLYLTALPQFSTSDQRKRLSLRLRGVLLKAWTLVGIPLVVSALAALARVESAEDTNTGFDG